MTDEELKRLKELTDKMRGEFDISGKELDEYLDLNIKRRNYIYGLYGGKE